MNNIIGKKYHYQVGPVKTLTRGLFKLQEDDKKASYLKDVLRAKVKCKDTNEFRNAYNNIISKMNEDKELINITVKNSFIMKNNNEKAKVTPINDK